MVDREIVDRLAEKAAQQELFLVGELHGTREAPRIIADILDALWEHGYRGLALELPPSEREALVEFARGGRDTPPACVGRPMPDGRASVELLDLVREASGRGWELLCIDAPAIVDRMERRCAAARIHVDAMCGSLLAQWDERCPEGRVLVLVGSVHSRRVRRGSPRRGGWPSFAANVGRLRPRLRIYSLYLSFHGGSYFNFGRKRLRARAIAAQRLDERGSFGHDGTLHLPKASAASYLGPFYETPDALRRPRKPLLGRRLHARFAAEQREWRRRVARRPPGEATPDDLARGRRAVERRTKLLKSVVRRYGWPTIELVGRMGAFAAAHFAFEATHDPDFQRRCLSLMEGALAEGQIGPDGYAKLSDLLRSSDGRPQLYGTQIEVRDGHPVPKAIDDPDHVDERRAALGLTTLAEYLRACAIIRSRWPSTA